MKRSDPDLSVERMRAREKSHAFCNTFFAVALALVSGLGPTAMAKGEVPAPGEQGEIAGGVEGATATSYKIPSVYAGRLADARNAKVKAYNLKHTEALVVGFLRYLKMTQKPDGRWDSGTVSTGSTSLALLCFLAHGEVPGQSEEFGPTVERAIQWLLNDQIKTEAEARRDHPSAPREGGSHAWRRGEVGYFKHRDTCNYAHLFAVYALAEAYAMTGRSDIKAALELAIPHITDGQNAKGGWYYNLDATCPIIDTSYASWAVQALKAAKLANVGDQREIVSALKKSVNGIKEFYNPDGSFGYTTANQSERRAYNGLTAACVFILQTLDLGDTPAARQALEYMQNWGPTFDKKKFKSNSSPQYYCYFLSQVRFNQGGYNPQWLAWHDQQRRLYTAAAIVISKKGGGYKDHEGNPQFVAFWPRKGARHKFGTESSRISDIERLKARPDTHDGKRLGFPIEQLINQDACTSEWEGVKSDIISSCFTALQLMVYYRNAPLPKGALTFIPPEREAAIRQESAEEVEFNLDEL